MVCFIYVQKDIIKVTKVAMHCTVTQSDWVFRKALMGGQSVQL